MSLRITDLKIIKILELWRNVRIWGEGGIWKFETLKIHIQDNYEIYELCIKFY